jgi:hypothetical protein
MPANSAPLQVSLRIRDERDAFHAAGALERLLKPDTMALLAK